jgi:uncharacterized protein YjdB
MDLTTKWVRGAGVGVLVMAAAACGGDGGTGSTAYDGVMVVVATPDVEVGVGEQARVVATAQNGGSTENVSGWSSSDASVALVDADGTVTGVREGTVTVTATYRTASGSATVKVHRKQVAKVVVSPGSVSLGALGDSVRLTATALDASGAGVAGAAFAFSTPDTQVVSVRGDGTVTARGTGIARVIAQSSGKADTCMISVVQVVAAVVLSPAAQTLQTGQSARLQAAARDGGGAPIAGASFTWASSNPAAVTVDPDGTVHGVAAGAATVTAKASNGVAGSSAVSVQGAPAVPIATLAVSPASVTLDAGGTQQLVAVAKDASGNVLTGRAVTWTSSSPAVASVGSGGVVAAAAAGSATVTAVSEGKSASAAVTVRAPAVPGTALAFQDGFESGVVTPVQTGYGWIYSSTVVPSRDIAHGGSYSLKFSYTGNPDLCADDWREQRFQLGENLTEVWFEYYLYIPSGQEGLGARYVHRAPNCAAQGDPNGVVGNNKFFALWDVDYSHKNVSAFVETRRSNTAGNGDSYLYGLWGSDTRPTSAWDHPNGTWEPAITDALRGRWTQIRLHVKLADSKAAANGMIQVWANGVLRVDMQNLDLAASPGGNQFFRYGYLLGYANSGFDQTTNLYVDDFRIFRGNPGW